MHLTAHPPTPPTPHGKNASTSFTSAYNEQDQCNTVLSNQKPEYQHIKLLPYYMDIRQGVNTYVL